MCYSITMKDDTKNNGWEKQKDGGYARKVSEETMITIQRMQGRLNKNVCFRRKVRI